MKKGSFIPNDPESRRKADETFRKLTIGDPDAGNSLDVAVAEIIAFVVTGIVLVAAIFFVLTLIAVVR